MRKQLGALSVLALARILPELRRDVVTYDKAVIAAGFEHHSNISAAVSGEIFPELPYYGEPLQRHVGFGTKYTARARHWTEADRKAHEEMGFHEGWGQCADQLAALVAKI